MAMTVLVISIILTVGILLLSLLTISQGYGYKHTIDPLEKNEDEPKKEKDDSNH